MTKSAMRTEEQIGAAVRLALSWHPSENGPSYEEAKAGAMTMVRAALAAAWQPIAHCKSGCIQTHPNESGET